jgi:hypothetical protein
MNRVEKDVRQFWEDSRAWKDGDAKRTYGDLLDSLNDTAETTKSIVLSTQIDDLAMLVIHAKRRRKKQPSLGSKKVTRLNLVTNNSVHNAIGELNRGVK